MEENEIFDFGEDPQDVTVDTPELEGGESADFSGNIFGSDEPEVEYDENGEVIEPQDDAQNDYINQVLQARGIDRNNIEITEEDGTVTTVKFDDLSDEDKIALLSDDFQPEDENPLTDADLEILNYFRANRINSLQEFADGIAREAIANYEASRVETPSYQVDTLGDDELLAWDLIQKFGDDISDEEVDEEIDRLKEDEEAYNKRVNLLRTYYKNEEEAQRKLYEEQQAAQLQQDTELFQKAYSDAAYNLDTIQGIDLEDNDKQDLLDYVLVKDQFGKTEFGKALEDPEQVLKMAWFLKHGEAAAEATRDYFSQLLAKERAAAKQAAAKPQTRAVSRPQATPAARQKQSNSFKF